MDAIFIDIFSAVSLGTQSREIGGSSIGDRSKKSITLVISMKDIFTKGHETIIELTNGRLVDVLKGCFFQTDTRILIKNGIIISLPGSSESEIEINPDISIDLKGKTVIPGLFNVHCHVQMINPTLFLDCKARKAMKKYHTLQVEKNMAECLSRGITNIRDAYTEDLRPNQQLVRRISSGEIAGPRIQQAVVVGALGGYLSPNLKGLNKKIVGLLGQGNIGFDDVNSGVVVFPANAKESEVRRTVDRAIDERGADLIKVGESLEKSIINSNPGIMEIDQLSAITDQAGKRGLQSTIHSVSVETFKRAVSAGFSSIAHVPRNGNIDAKDLEDCLETETVIDSTMSVAYDMSWRLKGNKFYDDPAVDKLYRYRDKVFAGLADEFWIPELKEVVKAGFNKAHQGKYKMFGLVDLSKLLAHFSGLPAYGFENAKMLFDRGIRMACGNDGGIQSCTPAMIAHELALMDLAINHEGTEKKFDPAEIIRTATIYSAKSMGMDDKFGSIEVGKNADLAIIDGNPFEDSSVVGKPVDALFMDGELVIDKIGFSGVFN